MKSNDYAFKLNANPSKSELNDALSAIYALTAEGAKYYESQAPTGYEELGSYVFNRILVRLNKDAGDAGLAPTWDNGLRVWMALPSWKTTPTYVRTSLSSGFIDYTRSFYSEFKHKPTDTQEQLYVFEKSDEEDKSVVSLEEMKAAFVLLSSDARKSLYKRFLLDSAVFSDELRNWFRSVCNAPVLQISDLYDLTPRNLDKIKKGLLAFRLDGSTFYNIKTTETLDGLSLTPF